MIKRTAEILNQINAQFYARNAASFSQTRNAPWEGWRRCMKACGFDSSGATISTQPANALVVDQPTDDRSSDVWSVRSFAPDATAERPACSVLDIACGNLRFEAFLARSYPQIDWQFFAVDNCEPLVEAGQEGIAKNVHFTCEDIVGNLIEGLPAAEPANIPALATATPFDLVVSFGFMHHIPSFEFRVRFLLEALDQVKEGGHLAVSFWQFMNDEAKRKKVEQTHAEALEFFSTTIVESHLETGASFLLGEEICPATRRCRASGGERRFVKGRDLLLEEANNLAAEELQRAIMPDQTNACINPEELEEGDYLLGWKNLPGQYRYCHHFSDAEIERIVVALEPYATVIDSFSADGKPGNLNRYVVFKRN